MCVRFTFECPSLASWTNISCPNKGSKTEVRLCPTFHTVWARGADARVSAVGCCAVASRLVTVAGSRGVALPPWLAARHPSWIAGATRAYKKKDVERKDLFYCQMTCALCSPISYTQTSIFILASFNNSLKLLLETIKQFSMRRSQACNKSVQSFHLAGWKLLDVLPVRFLDNFKIELTKLPTLGLNNKMSGFGIKRNENII